MSGLVPGGRSRMRPFHRSLRRRPEPEESHGFVDWSKGIRENVKQFLTQLVAESDSSKSSKLWSLNCLTKLSSRLSDDSDAKELDFESEEIFCCLRVALLDEAYEVRAAGLRAMRHFIRNRDMARAFLVSNQIHLVVRSLDINLDNKIERLQALRLVRHLIAVMPSDVPLAAARALVAVARDGLQESDSLTRPCWATIAELCLRNPVVAGTTGCFSALLDAVLQPNVPSAICESLIGVIVFTLNDPVLRHHLREDQDLQHFVSPFTDCYNTSNASSSADHHHCESSEQRELRFVAARRAILTIARSWSGLIYFCRYSCDTSRGSNAIQSLIETLHMPYDDTRRNVLELMFDLLNLRMPTLSSSDSEEFSFDILSSYHAWSVQDSWQVYDGFVASEGRSLLAPVSKCRINLFDNYLSIVLYTLVSYGVIEALVQVIITPKAMSFSNAVRATVLLAEILHLSSRLLPHEVYRKCHGLPDLVNAATCPSYSLEVRGIASTAIAALDRIHAQRRTSVTPFSLYLEQMMRFASTSSLSHLSDAKSRMQVKMSVAHEAEVITGSYIRDSNVLTHDHHNYNWNLITSLLSWPAEDFKRLEDPSYRTFVRKLLEFFKPSGRGFSRTDINDEMGRTKALVCCHFVEFLLEVDDVRSLEFLGDFVNDLSDALSQVSVQNAPQNASLSSTKLMTTLSHYYFLVIGRMTSSNKGSKLLEKVGIYQHMSALIGNPSHDVYTKLIISSLDYSKEGFSRKLLARSLTTGSESSRLYATNLMLVLLRVSISDFHKWAIPLLVHQLYDECESVSLAAASILLESCDQPQHLQALISLKPSLLHLKHTGLLVQIRFASTPIGIKYLTETHMLDVLLTEWRRTLNLKYVRVVEDAMNEALTMHFRSESGTYGSHRSDKKTVETNTFLPPHLYGQLAMTDIGMKILTNDDYLEPAFQVIGKQDYSSQRKILEMKASLWAVGHVASSLRGLCFIREHDSEIMTTIIRMTTDCSLLSLRGTCFYVLGLIAMTEEGIRHLQLFGWEGLKHSRDESWPMEEAEDHQNLFQCFRPCKRYATSISSSIGVRFHEDRRQSNLLSPDEQDDQSCSTFNPDESRSRASSLGIHLTVRSMPEDRMTYRKLIDGHVIPCREVVVANGASVAVKDISDGKDRACSYNPDASISSGISPGSGGLSVHNLGKSFPKLSPIASMASTNNAYSLQSCYPTLQAAGCVSISPKDHQQTIPCTTGSDHAHVHHQPFESIPTSTDGHGYATLRAISRHRVHSMRLPQSEKSVIAADGSTSPAESCSSSESDVYDENDIFSNSKTLVSCLSSPAGDVPADIDPSPESDPLSPRPVVEEPKTWIGIVIPVSLALFLEPPESPINVYKSLNTRETDDDVPATPVPRPVYKTHMDTLPATAIHLNYGLELHSKRTCLLCYRVREAQDGGRQLGVQVNGYASCGEEDGSSVRVSSTPHLQPHTLKHIVSASSITSCSSVENAVSSDQVLDHQLIRREVLRFVTNLSGSVAAKAAEQGMLNLKQRFPRGFKDDICLYSEVCLQMSTYNFRLPARKFLQEIFQDIDYSRLKAYAKEIVGQKSSHSLQELDDEKDEDRNIGL